MSHDYDKVIKENLQEIFLSLTERFFGFTLLKSEALPEKIQTTTEREVDFVRKVTSKEGETFILHLEFQTTDEAAMVYRMAEYHAIFLRKYRLVVRCSKCCFSAKKVPPFFSNRLIIRVFAVLLSYF